MKPSNPLPSSSSARYRVASFKRFLNYMFWGPPLMLASVLFVVWQYQQHPEWLSGTEGNTLPQSNQFEEPGIYDNPTPSGGNLPIDPNLPPITTPIPNIPNPPTANNPPTNRPNTAMPNLFLPLVPKNTPSEQGNNPSPPVNPNPLPEYSINPSGESELQKAMKRNLNSSSPIQGNDSSIAVPNNTSGTPANQPPQSSPNMPNTPYSSSNPAPNPVNPYITQPAVSPQIGYQSPVNNPYLNNSSANGSTGQNYMAPTLNNPYNAGNPQRDSNGSPLINGRPAPQFQPSINGNRRDY